MKCYFRDKRTLHDYNVLIVISGGTILYRDGTRKHTETNGEKWIRVKGNLEYISSGHSIVVGTSKDQHIWIKTGDLFNFILYISFLYSFTNAAMCKGYKHSQFCIIKH